MRDLIEDQPGEFDVSVRDFRRKATAFGWPFWRGVLIGFLASFPLASILVTGAGPFGTG